jgi:hypothetical protein
LGFIIQLKGNLWLLLSLDLNFRFHRHIHKTLHHNLQIICPDVFVHLKNGIFGPFGLIFQAFLILGAVPEMGDLLEDGWPYL